MLFNYFGKNFFEVIKVEIKNNKKPVIIYTYFALLFKF